MGYTEQDWKAINTIRTLAVSSTPSCLCQTSFRPPAPAPASRAPPPLDALDHDHNGAAMAWTRAYNANRSLDG